ncbi:MAG: HAMP domain-containing histidine kinase, partial [Opitutales bacterium]|nr:HAMP domain-containing histidine kinase [Opitutales bacterium]
VESLSDGALHSPELAGKFLKILNTQGKRLNALVQDILSLAALERRELAGKEDFELFQLDAALENAVNACAENAEASGIELCITRNEPQECVGDARLIEQAVINLVGNAVKYSGGSRIEVAQERKGKSIVISVRDFGVGIPEEHLSRLFERFYRVHKERSQKLGGTGLGLAIVKHIAQLHGGTATAESRPEQGCCFRITLPFSGFGEA